MLWWNDCASVLCRSGTLLDEVYGQEVMFVANDWHAALLPLLLTARFRWGQSAGRGACPRPQLAYVACNTRADGAWGPYRLCTLAWLDQQVYGWPCDKLGRIGCAPHSQTERPRASCSNPGTWPRHLHLVLLSCVCRPCGVYPNARCCLATHITHMCTPCACVCAGRLACTPMPAAAWPSTTWPTRAALRHMPFMMWACLGSGTAHWSGRPQETGTDARPSTSSRWGGNPDALCVLGCIGL
jgi:hypothetical protein